MKKLLPIVSSVMAFVIMLSAFSISASASSKIVDIEGVLYDCESELQTFTIKNKMKVSVNFKSKNPTFLSIMDENGLYVVDTNEVTSYSETITLTKGKYSFFIRYYQYDEYYDYDYDIDYNYTLSTYYTLVIKDISESATSIKLKSKSKKMSVGESFTVNYKAVPSGTVAKISKWSSSNKKVATVNSSGKVKAKGLGTCKITAELNNGKKFTCKVTVNSKDIYIFKNTQRTLPKINGKKTVSWKTNNRNYASVNKQKVRGRKAGKTSLSAKYSGIKYKCKIYVVDYDKMFKDSKEKLKDELRDPDSMKIYHIWRGYDVDGDPTIVLDYGSKNAYGGYYRGYYCYFRHYSPTKKKFKNRYYFPDEKPKLTAQKKIK